MKTYGTYMKSLLGTQTMPMEGHLCADLFQLFSVGSMSCPGKVAVWNHRPINDLNQAVPCRDTMGRRTRLGISGVEQSICSQELNRLLMDAHVIAMLA